MSTQIAIPLKTRLTAMALVIVLSATALACSVPVFRYAIEHWRPDAYRILVYHDQDLTEADRKLLETIAAQAKAGANVQVQTFDLRTELEAIDQARWQAHTGSALPRMVVQLPAGIGNGEAPVAVADWNRAEVDALIESPARTDIGQRLVAGEVVWVFLDSEQADESDRLFQVLNEQLAIQQETLELPEIDAADLKDLSADPESLEIAFSVVRVSRTDVAEKWFVEMLLSIEPDLRDPELIDQPMVFPIFGRGRALYALVGEGINADMIRDAATFLTGACQCTVKAENPGVDLLISMPWDNVIEVSQPLEVSLPLVGLGGGMPLAKSQESNSSESGGDAAPALLGDVPPLSGADTAGDDAVAANDAATAPLVTTVGVSTEAAPAGVGLWMPILLILVLAVGAGIGGTALLRR